MPETPYTPNLEWMARPSEAGRQTRQSETVGDWLIRYVFEEQPGHGTVVASINITPASDVFEAVEATPGSAPPGGLTARTLRNVPMGPTLIAKKTSMAPPRRPGSNGRSDLYYARIAKLHTDAVAAGSRRPHVDVAAQLDGHSAHYVRDVVAEAHRRGLVTKGTRGKATRRLTAKAKRLLAGSDG
jgi:hypothetical protein